MYHKRKVFLQLLSFAVKTPSQASKQVRQDKKSEANCLVSGKDGIEKQGKQDQLPNICFDGDILPHLGFSPGRPSHEGSCLKKPMPRLPGSSAATSCVCPDAAPWVAKQILLSCSSLAASCHCWAPQVAFQAGIPRERQSAASSASGGRLMHSWHLTKCLNLG